MEKPALLALAVLCLFAAGCKTTPPKTASTGSASTPATQTQSQAQAQAPAGGAQAATGSSSPPASSQVTQPAEGEQQPGTQAPVAGAPRQKGGRPAASTPQRPGKRTPAATQLKNLWSAVSTGVAAAIKRIGSVLGGTAKSPRRPAPQAPAVRVRGPLVPPDILPLIVTGGIILAGSCLALATIIAGRRKSRPS